MAGSGLLVGLTGCGQPSNTPSSYNDQTKANYIAGCTGGFEGSNTSLAPLSVCKCQYDFFATNVSMPDFEKLQNDINKDPSSADATKYNDKLKACTGENVTPAGTSQPTGTTPATSPGTSAGSIPVGPLAPGTTATP